MSFIGFGWSVQAQVVIQPVCWKNCVCMGREEEGSGKIESRHSKTHHGLYTHTHASFIAEA